jgi:hypothetical protein
MISNNINYKKTPIPKTLKIAVWEKYYGEDIGKAKCLCCDLTDITQLKFECGHIVAESKGGETKIDNLIPICSNCNKSMGTKNYFDFKNDIFGEDKNDNIDDIDDIDDINEIHKLKEKYRKCEIKKKSYEEEKVKFEIKKIMENEKMKKINSKIQMLIIKKEINKKKDNDDFVSDFLNECTIETNDKRDKIHCSTLYNTYKKWLTDIKKLDCKLSNKAFVNNLKMYKDIYKLNIEGLTQLGIKNTILV